MEIESILTEVLHPNAYNPNRMTDDEFAEYVSEVRRLNAIPKPIIVRPAENGSYEIVDGEHAWKAAKEVGLAEVPCEVQQVDDFEAMRQTYKRNQHGTHNPVLEGLMFQQMLTRPDGAELSNRELAKELGISEGTIRKRLEYVEAAELRSAYAGENRDTEIGQLTLRQLQLYFDLPAAVGDIWLDAGGHVQNIDRYCTADLTVAKTFRRIVDAGLAKTLIPKFGGFVDSVDQALDLCDWAERHFRIDVVKPYLRIVAELDLPPNVLEELPCEIVHDQVSVLLSPEQWAETLNSCHERASDTDDCIQLVSVSVRKLLREAGVDPASIAGCRELEELEVIARGPDFIRDADFLSTDEKYFLVTAVDDVPDELLQQAKRLTCEVIRQRRAQNPDPSASGQRSGYEGVKEVLTLKLDELIRESRSAIDAERFRSRDNLNRAIMATLAAAKVMDEAQLGGQAAAEVLAARLEAIAWPELQLVASLIFNRNSIADGLVRWLDAMRSENPKPAAASES